LERIAYGTVAVTTRALTAVGLDLTFAQWRVLVIVGNDDDGTPMSDVALRLGAALSPTSRLVGRMAQRGFVQLEKDDIDRRVTRVTLSDQGLAIRQAVREKRLELLREVVSAADPVPPETVAALERIADAFSRYR
jgi:DNA-binding MarR family transcriptional regulator